MTLWQCAFAICLLAIVHLYSFVTVCLQVHHPAKLLLAQSEFY